MRLCARNFLAGKLMSCGWQLMVRSNSTNDMTLFIKMHAMQQKQQLFFGGQIDVMWMADHEEVEKHKSHKDAFQNKCMRMLTSCRWELIVTMYKSKNDIVSLCKKMNAIMCKKFFGGQINVMWMAADGEKQQHK